MFCTFSSSFAPLPLVPESTDHALPYEISVLLLYVSFLLRGSPAGPRIYHARIVEGPRYNTKVILKVTPQDLGALLIMLLSRHTTVFVTLFLLSQRCLFMSQQCCDSTLLLAPFFLSPFSSCRKTEHAYICYKKVTAKRRRTCVTEQVLLALLAENEVATILLRPPYDHIATSFVGGHRSKFFLWPPTQGSPILTGDWLEILLHPDGRMQ